MMGFRDCCKIVLEECPDGYAKAYAKAGLERWEMHDQEYMRVQCLYILNNLSRWRGPRAKLVRQNLKRLSKEKVT